MKISDEAVVRNWADTVFRPYIRDDAVCATAVLTMHSAMEDGIRPLDAMRLAIAGAVLTLIAPEKNPGGVKLVEFLREAKVKL